MNMQSSSQTPKVSALPTRQTQITDLLYGILGLMAGVALIMAVQRLAPAFTVRTPILSLPGSIPAVLSSEARTMGLPLAGESPAYWYAARSGGVIAYLLLWMATFWGVAMSGKMLKGLVPAALVYGLHEFLPLLALGFTAFHALVLLGDAYIGFSVVDILVPFASSYNRIWTGMGVLTFYLSLALVASFYLRSRMGRRAWRTLHYASFLAFAMALIHGVMAGTDAGSPFMSWLYLFTGGTVLFATFYRIFAGKSARKTVAVSHRSPRKTVV